MLTPGTLNGFGGSRLRELLRPFLEGKNLDRRRLRGLGGGSSVSARNLDKERLSENSALTHGLFTSLTAPWPASLRSSIPPSSVLRVPTTPSALSSATATSTSPFHGTILCLPTTPSSKRTQGLLIRIGFGNPVSAAGPRSPIPKLPRLKRHNTPIIALPSAVSISAIPPHGGIVGERVVQVIYTN